MKPISCSKAIETTKTLVGGQKAEFSLPLHKFSDAQVQSSPGHPLSVSMRSLVGLNAANFFLAEASGVVIPFLNDFLKVRNWRYDAIGVATALAGLGVLVMQTPAGFLVDRLPQRRALLAAASIMMGLCFGILPLVPPRWWIVDPLLFMAGSAQAFLVPLLGALALGLVGYEGLSRVMGSNQAWNHAGNFVSALSAIALVGWFGSESIFYAVIVISILAALSVFLVRRDELDEKRASGVVPKESADASSDVSSLAKLLRDPRVLVLFAATALFHLANAPVMPLVGLYVKHLGGSDTQLAAVVLMAQVVMVPVALAAGWLCEHWGRKPLFAVAFCVLPLRILLYSFTSSPSMLIALQTLDGIGAGIYGVVIVSICADLTQGTGRFNSLVGLIATALAIGGVIGPLTSGVLVQQLGFAVAFYAFAAIAAIAAVVFLWGMPEIKPRSEPTGSTAAR